MQEFVAESRKALWRLKSLCGFWMMGGGGLIMTNALMQQIKGLTWLLQVQENRELKY